MTELGSYTSRRLSRTEYAALQRPQHAPTTHDERSKNLLYHVVVYAADTLVSVGNLGTLLVINGETAAAESLHMPSCRCS